MSRVSTCLNQDTNPPQTCTVLHKHIVAMNITGIMTVKPSKAIVTIVSIVMLTVCLVITLVIVMVTVIVDPIVIILVVTITSIVPL